jgi:hypothetical protein
MAVGVNETRRYEMMAGIDNSILSTIAVGQVTNRNDRAAAHQDVALCRFPAGRWPQDEAIANQNRRHAFGTSLPPK